MLKKIAQRQIIVVIDADSLSNVHGAQLRSLQPQDDIRRQVVVEVAAVEQVLADASGVQIVIGVVLLPREEMKFEPRRGVDGQLGPAAAAVYG
jgi:hypothetical protein